MLEGIEAEQQRLTETSESLHEELRVMTDSIQGFSQMVSIAEIRIQHVHEV